MRVEIDTVNKTIKVLDKCSFEDFVELVSNTFEKPEEVMVMGNVYGGSVYFTNGCTCGGTSTLTNETY